HGGHNCWIETLEMTNLRDAFSAFSDRNELIAFSQTVRQRLLNQHIRAGFHQLLRNRSMFGGGDSNRHSVNFFDLTQRRAGARGEFPGKSLGALAIDIHYANQRNASAFALKLVIHASVVAAKRARPNHGHTKILRSSPRSARGSRMIPACLPDAAWA